NAPQNAPASMTPNIPPVKATAIPNPAITSSNDYRTHIVCRNTLWYLQCSQVPRFSFYKP
ncbi:hypothetical protein, partial [Acetivibrio straminisolvens]|uniref:hypothetical protein n=1 Tax=Acetivibrio straminisolvens TaxID=253314 RepID=UPI0023527472